MTNSITSSGSALHDCRHNSNYTSSVKSHSLRRFSVVPSTNAARVSARLAAFGKIARSAERLNVADYVAPAFAYWMHVVSCQSASA